LNAQDIKALLQGKFEDKIKGMKSLVCNIINDDSFDKLTMTIITYVVPFQAEDHSLKKILLFYWEVTRIFFNNPFEYHFLSAFFDFFFT
jgi:coatomer subunit beta